MILNKLLPAFCYPNRKLIQLRFLVIHYFSGRFAFPDDKYNMHKCYNLFIDLNLPADKRIDYKIPDLKARSYASAKYLIGRCGSIWQLTPDGYEQYHAGRSSWKIGNNEYIDLNKFSDGVELINDGKDEYADEQYKSLTWLISNYYKTMTLNIDMDSKKKIYQPVNGSLITGHENISPDRKQDPGNKFNWLLLQNMLESYKNKPFNLNKKN